MTIKSKKAVLFNPLPREEKAVEFNYVIPPISLLAVASLADKNGYDIKIIDATVNPNYAEDIIREAEGALCFGVTALTGHQIFNGLAMSKAVKEKYPGISVVWGGYHPSILPEQTAESEFVDVVAPGQGERTFLELLNCFEKNLPLDEIKGIVYKKNGKITSTAPRDFENINNFPEIPYHLINVKKYIYDGTSGGVGQKCFGIRTSQGCPWNCGFCAETKVTKRRWSGFTPERVVAELKFLADKYGVDGVLIYDTDFLVDKERVRKILKGMIEQKVKVRFSFVNGRTDQILDFDDELWNLFKQVGCTDFLMGGEAGTDELLRYINKEATVQNTIDSKKALSKYGFTSSFSFMIGLPVDKSKNITPQKELEWILELVEKIMRVDNDNNIRMFNYTPYPGTPLFEDAKKRGIEVPDSLYGWGLWDNTRANAKWIPAKYESILNQLNWYILPYTSKQFDGHWEERFTGRFKSIKKAFHGVMKKMAYFRLKHRFFALPVEYNFLMFARRMKAKKGSGIKL